MCEILSVYRLLHPPLRPQVPRPHTANHPSSSVGSSLSNTSRRLTAFDPALGRIIGWNGFGRVFAMCSKAMLSIGAAGSSAMSRAQKMCYDAVQLQHSITH